MCTFDEEAATGGGDAASGRLWEAIWNGFEMDSLEEVNTAAAMWNRTVWGDVGIENSLTY